MAILTSIALLAAGLAGQPYAEKPRPARTLAEMEPVLQKIAAWQFDQSREPLYEFSEFVQGALATPTALRAIEDRLLGVLRSNATLAGKDYVCRQLSVMGSAASVPVLAGMLLNPDTSDMARYALDGIPGPAPAEALLAALPKASGKIRIGIVNSLGQRRVAAAVPALKALLAPPESDARAAVLGALAAIGDAAALEVLAGAGSSEAYLRCAEKVAASGDKATAVKAYRRLLEAGEPEMVRAGALQGLFTLIGREAGPDLEREAFSSSPKLQATAIRLLNELPGSGATKFLVRLVSRLSAPRQVQVLAALGERGDLAARTVVTETLKSSDRAVRTSAATALGRLGNGPSAALLAEMAARSEGTEQAAARDALVRMRGTDVETVIVAGIASGAGGPRLEMIRAAGDRGMASAGDALVRAARDPDREVRRDALRALRNVAGPAQSQPLLELLLKVEDESDRRDAVRALAAALRRAGGTGIGGTIAAYESAEKPVVRAALLEVMGQVSADEALPVLRGSLKDPAPEISRAAILALSEWLTPAPLADLLEVAKSGATPAQQILALRGAVRLIAAPSDRSVNETVQLLAQTMRLAQQPEEKRAILSSLSNYATKESLKIVEDAAADAAVAREAKAAASRIRLSLGAQR